jgi:hypothetical protein
MDSEDRHEVARTSDGISRAQWALAGVIVALALGMLFYRWLHAERLGDTAALYIGLPTLIAVALALTPRAKSSTGMIMKGMTIAMLMAGPVLKEGILCIIFSSPLFYLVGAIVGWSIDRDRKRREQGGGPVYVSVLIPLIIASMEGVTPALSPPASHTVRVERTVFASPQAIETKLASTPTFEPPLPAFLSFKFPMPYSGEGEGLSIGDGRRMLYHRDGEVNELMFVVADRAPGYVRFHAVSDDTKMARWLIWREAEVRWAGNGDGTTQVEWTLQFDRRLNPAWYFGPLESYGASEAAGYLIDALATP